MGRRARGAVRRRAQCCGAVGPRGAGDGCRERRRRWPRSPRRRLVSEPAAVAAAGAAGPGRTGDDAAMGDMRGRAAASAADGPPALRFPYDASVLTDAPLRTERLVLRPLEASDAPDVFEYQRLSEVIRYLPWPERDRAEAYEHTSRRAAGRILAADGDFVFFAAILPGEPSAEEPDRDRVIGDFMVRVSSAQHAQL